MRVLASGSIFFESGRDDLLGILKFPGHFENKILVEKKKKSDRKPAQKDKRLYPNSSPRSGGKFEKKKNGPAWK